MSESDEQQALIKWFDIQYPQYSKCLIASQSGVIVGGKNKFAQIAKLKKEGWKKGVPDLFLALPKNGKHGLWIEMKDVNKTIKYLSEEQSEYLKLFSSLGYEAIWCAGFDVAKAAIEVYMND